MSSGRVRRGRWATACLERQKSQARARDVHRPKTSRSTSTHTSLQAGSGAGTDPRASVQLAVYKKQLAA